MRKLSERILLAGLFALLLTSGGRSQDRIESGPWKGFRMAHPESELVEINPVFTAAKVRGRIIFPDDPLPDVIVELQGPGESPLMRETKTNLRGEFSFGSLPEGTYRFKATKDGFCSSVGKIVVARNASKKTLVSFQMHLGI